MMEATRESAWSAAGKAILRNLHPVPARRFGPLLNCRAPCSACQRLRSLQQTCTSRRASLRRRLLDCKLFVACERRTYRRGAQCSQCIRILANLAGLDTHVTRRNRYNPAARVGKHAQQHYADSDPGSALALAIGPGSDSTCCSRQATAPAEWARTCCCLMIPRALLGLGAFPCKSCSPLTNSAILSSVATCGRTLLSPSQVAILTTSAATPSPVGNMAPSQTTPAPQPAAGSTTGFSTAAVAVRMTCVGCDDPTRRHIVAVVPVCMCGMVVFPNAHPHGQLRCRSTGVRCERTGRCTYVAEDCLLPRRTMPRCRGSGLRSPSRRPQGRQPRSPPAAASGSTTRASPSPRTATRSCCAASPCSPCARSSRSSGGRRQDCAWRRRCLVGLSSMRRSDTPFSSTSARVRSQCRHGCSTPASLSCASPCEMLYACYLHRASALPFAVPWCCTSLGRLPLPHTTAFSMNLGRYQSVVRMLARARLRSFCCAPRR